jgi:hypothetical protein
MDCAMFAAAPVLPTGYVVSASQIANRRMILVGYRFGESADTGNFKTLIEEEYSSIIELTRL